MLLCLLPLGVDAQRVDTLAEAHATTFRSQPATAVPAYSLDSAALQRRGVVSLSDALQRLPGVVLRDYGGAGGLKTVSVRGMGAQHTQVLLDGLPVGNAQTGAVDMSRYDLSALSALSLTLGDSPRLLASARSLSQATIELKSADSSREIALSQASWNAWSPSASFWMEKGLKVGGRASYAYADNNYPYQFGGERRRRGNSQISSVDSRISVAKSARWGVLTAGGAYWQSDRGLPGPVYYYTSRTTGEKMHDKEALAHAQYHYQRGAWQVQGALKYSWHGSLYLNPSSTLAGPSRQDYSLHEAYATGGLSFQPFSWLGMAYVADYTCQTMRSNMPEYGEVARHTLQQVVSVELKSGRWHSMIRLMDHLVRDVSNSLAAPSATHRLTPSVSLSYVPVEGMQLRAFYKDYFRMPSFSELYYFHLGTPYLKPERTRQVGVGVAERWRLEKFLARLSVDAYYGGVDNRIVSIPYNLFVWRTVNMDRVRTAGADVETLLEQRWERHELSLSATYGFQYAQAEGHVLPYMPKHTFSASLGWENPSVNSAISVVYASRRTTTLTPSVPSTILPAYYEVNLSLWRDFSVWQHRLRCKADVLNLTNHRHAVIARYPMPGISYRITFNYTL